MEAIWVKGRDKEPDQNCEDEYSQIQRGPWKKNLLQSTCDLRLGLQFIFQHDNDSKHTARTMLEWLQDTSLTIIEWPSQSLDLNSIELWADLKFHRCSPSNLMELERICKEELNKLSKAGFAKLVENCPRSLKAVIAATDFWIQGWEASELDLFPLTSSLFKDRQEVLSARQHWAFARSARQHSRPRPGREQ